MWGVLVNLLREYAAAVTAAGGHRGGGEEARLACRLLNQCTYTPGTRPPPCAPRLCPDLPSSVDGWEQTVLVRSSGSSSCQRSASAGTLADSGPQLSAAIGRRCQVGVAWAWQG